MRATPPRTKDLLPSVASDAGREAGWTRRGPPAAAVGRPGKREAWEGRGDNRQAVSSAAIIADQGGYSQSMQV
jgi:hypothetical protein